MNLRLHPEIVGQERRPGQLIGDHDPRRVRAILHQRPYEVRWVLRIRIFLKPNADFEGPPSVATGGHFIVNYNQPARHESTK